MKTIFTLSLFLISYFSKAQVAKLSIENPAPRVGSEIHINVSFKKGDIEKKQKMTDQEFFELLKNNLGGGEVSFDQVALDTGNQTIGPFKFHINNKEFTTDTLRVKVYPKLPPIKDGIWVKQVKYMDQEYVILEQRVSNHWKEDAHGNLTIDPEGANYAFLDNFATRELGFLVEESASWSGSETIEEGDLVLGTGSVAHKITKYKLTRLKSATGSLKLNKSLFKNYPKGVELFIE